MSLSKKRHARKNTRATLSGRLVPAGTEFPAHPAWHSVVQPQPKQSPVIRDGHWYADVRDALPNPEDLKVVVEGTEFTGRNRAERRQVMKARRSSILGMYTKGLHRDLGNAWADNLEARRLMRERQAAARLAAKYATVTQ